MPSFLNVLVVPAYHAVSAYVRFFAPLPGGLAAAVAVITFTMTVRLLLSPLSYRSARGLAAQARLAPRVRELRAKYARQPDRLQSEMAALYRCENIGMFAGCLPLLMQWPFLGVVYLLFRSPVVAGVHNTLLTRTLLGVPLGAHWLAAPVSPHGAVFLALFTLLALTAWLSTVLLPRLAPATPAPGQPTRALTDPPTPARPAPPPPLVGQLTKAMPYLTVLIAMFMPLAAGLYLLTTAAWTLGERAVLSRRLQPNH